jgi:heterodisulfide reductase subunit C
MTVEQIKEKSDHQEVESTTIIEPDQEFSRKLVEAGAVTLHNCIQCGTCTGSCPSGKHTALRIRKLIRAAQLGLKDILDQDDLWLCTTCYTCFERCPNEVDVPQIIMVIRNFAVQAGFVAETHKQAVRKFLETGHLVPLTDEISGIREEIGLRNTPPTVQADIGALKLFQDFLKTLAIKKLAAEGEG